MPDPAAVQPAEGGVKRRFLTFRVDDRLYALPAEDVSGVIGIPPAARVPQSPKSLLGLANLRGSVLPLVSLRILLGRDAGGAADSARAIVLDGATPIVLAVDAVVALVVLDSSRIEARQAELSAEPGEKLSGAFRIHADQDVTKILDLQGMLDAAFGQRTRPANTARAARTPAPARDTAGAAGNQQLLVTFDVAGQEYALGLEAVREIVPLPSTIAAAPRAEAVLLGVASYREGVLPLLSLRSLLGFPAASAVEGSEKVVVTQVGGVLVGLVADRMRAIIQADARLIDPAPSMLAARTGGEARIKAIFRGDGGRRLVSVLAPEQLFREDVMQRLGDSSGTARPQPEAAGPDRGETVQFLVFRLGDEEFGLPISAVDEVARVPDKITRVPKTPKFLEGVINLRGEVLPVVDQRKRFDLPKFTGGEGQRLIVVRTERHRAGLIVDSVSEVLRSPAEAIEPAFDLTEQVTRLVSGVINLEANGRLILLLDPSELLSRAERGLLDAFDAGPGHQAAL
jgi:purine-binding chemotaxis protein CheW